MVCGKGFRDNRSLLRHEYEHIVQHEAVLDVPPAELASYMRCVEQIVIKYSQASKDAAAGGARSGEKIHECTEGASADCTHWSRVGANLGRGSFNMHHHGICWKVCQLTANFSVSRIEIVGGSSWEEAGSP